MQLSEFAKMAQMGFSLQPDPQIALLKRSEGCVLSTFGVDLPHLASQMGN